MALQWIPIKELEIRLVHLCAAQGDVITYSQYKTFIPLSHESFILPRSVCKLKIFSRSIDCEQRVINQFFQKERIRPAQIHRRLEAPYDPETYNLRNISVANSLIGDAKT
jgi:hypothetical protein